MPKYTTVGQVLLVGEDEYDRVAHLAVVDDAVQLLARLVDTVAVRAVHHEYQALRAWKHTCKPSYKHLVNIDKSQPSSGDYKLAYIFFENETKYSPKTFLYSRLTRLQSQRSIVNIRESVLETSMIKFADVFTPLPGIISYKF